jgi:hypothetical protein
MTLRQNGKDGTLNCPVPLSLVIFMAFSLLPTLCHIAGLGSGLSPRPDFMRIQKRRGTRSATINVNNFSFDNYLLRYVYSSPVEMDLGTRAF